MLHSGWLSDWRRCSSDLYSSKCKTLELLHLLRHPNNILLSGHHVSFFQGCYNKVVNFLDTNIGLVAGAAVGIAFFPLVGVILSCCLASIVNKTKYEPMA